MLERPLLNQAAFGRTISRKAKKFPFMSHTAISTNLCPCRKRVKLLSFGNFRSPTATPLPKWPYPSSIRQSMCPFNSSRYASYLKSAHRTRNNYTTHSFISVHQKLGILHVPKCSCSQITGVAIGEIGSFHHAIYKPSP